MIVKPSINQEEFVRGQKLQSNEMHQGLSNDELPQPKRLSE